jgi:hypothetical protein
MSNLSLKFIFCILCAMANLNSFAQDQIKNAEANKEFSKSSVFIGTQVPLQNTIGYGYQFSDRFSARAQVGILTKPYDGLIINSLEAFGLDKYLGKVIKKAFKQRHSIRDRNKLSFCKKLCWSFRSIHSFTRRRHYAWRCFERLF